MFIAAITDDTFFKRAFTVHTGFYSPKAWALLNDFFTGISLKYSTCIMPSDIYGCVRRASDGEAVFVVEYFKYESDVAFSKWMNEMTELCKQIIANLDKFEKKLMTTKAKLRLGCRMVLGTLNDDEKAELVGRPWNPFEASKVVVMINDLKETFKTATDAYWSKLEAFQKTLKEF